MLRRILIIVAAAVLLGALLRTAGDRAYWQRYAGALASADPAVTARGVDPRVRIPGGGASAVPRADGAAQGIAPEAITEALRQAQDTQARALLVHRRGHRIGEYYGPGITADTQIAGGDLAPALLALAAGTLVDDGAVDAPQALDALDEAIVRPAATPWRNPWSAGARKHFALQASAPFLPQQVAGPLPEFLSRQLWQRLGAGDAWLWGRDAGSVRLDCCVVARFEDWMRIADLLLQQGVHEGERIVAADWVRQLLPGGVDAPRRLRWVPEPAGFTGGEPPAARDALWVDLDRDTRLWLLPQRGLAILHWARAGSGLARDTTLLNIVVRGIVDTPVITSEDAGIDALVPAH